MPDDIDPALAAQYRARGLASMCRAEGQFSLLFDETFTVLWHTESVSVILGYESLVGRNGTDYLHPDDVALVVDMLTQFGSRQIDAGAGPAFRPDPSDVRVLAASGAWVTMEAVTFDHTGDPWIRGFLVTCKLITDRSDIGRSIELLGTGAHVGEVLPLVARLGDRSMGSDARCFISWWHDDDVCVAWSPDGVAPDPRLASIAKCALRAGVREPKMLSLADTDDVLLRDLGCAPSDLGYAAVTFAPLTAPGGDEVIGCFVGWGQQLVELALQPQMPLHLGLRIAALAIMDGRTKHDLRWAAAHDPLTLLSNRAEFSRRLEEMNTSDIALLYIDLDDFKPINDLHGHQVGDGVLVEVAARIRETVGVIGVACRLGGDEFAVACPGVSDVMAGWELADRVAAVIRRPIRIGSITLAVGASIGVAMGAQPLIPSILIQRADEALLEAKHSGKNTVRIAS